MSSRKSESKSAVDSMSREELVVAYEATEKKRLEMNKRSGEYQQRRRERDPEFLPRKTAQISAYQRRRYSEDPEFRAATIARAKEFNARNSALLYLRRLFVEAT